MSQNDFLPFLFAAAALSSLFRVVVVVVVLVVGVVVVVVCVARAPLLQHAHRHVAVCNRECTSSSSSCVSCSTARSHRILVFHVVRACTVLFLQNAHWHTHVRVRGDQYDYSQSCHRRASCCPFGDCSVFRASFLSFTDPLFHQICSRIASCSWNLSVQSSLVVITIMPLTDICFVLCRCGFNGTSHIVLR